MLTNVLILSPSRRHNQDKLNEKQTHETASDEDTTSIQWYMSTKFAMSKIMKHPVCMHKS